MVNAKEVVAEQYASSVFVRQRLLNVLSQLSSGLMALHSKRIVHRDIKPENVLISRDRIEKTGGCGCSYDVRIADYGCAKVMPPNVLIPREGTDSINGTRRKLSSSFSHVGTPEFMSPEMVMSDPVGHTILTDVWSLGVTTFVMLNGGKFPESPSSKSRQVDDGADSEYSRYLFTNYSQQKLEQVVRALPTDFVTSALVLSMLQRRPYNRRRLETISLSIHTSCRGVPNHPPSSTLSASSLNSFQRISQRKYRQSGRMPGGRRR